jgi:hypothetical protein
LLLWHHRSTILLQELLLSGFYLWLVIKNLIAVDDIYREDSKITMENVFLFAG